jgi:hypothetical protein
LKEDETLMAGGYLYLSFNRQWSKLCKLLQADANDAKVKKKFKIFDSDRIYF